MGIHAAVSEAQNVVYVLQVGEATRGQIVETRENYSVSVNGRHPWSFDINFRPMDRAKKGR